MSLRSDPRALVELTRLPAALSVPGDTVAGSQILIAFDNGEEE